MRPFKQEKVFGNRRSGKPFGGRDAGARGFGSGARGPVTMNKAICDDCRKACEVPFKPTGNRPVYCSDCFRNHDEGGGSARFKGGNFERPAFPGRRESPFKDKPMFGAVCAECKKRCEVPFRPIAGKPVYCDQCFGKGSEVTRGKSTDPYADQFKAVHEKLDKIVRMLNPVIPVKEIPAERAPEKQKTEIGEVKKQEPGIPTKNKTRLKNKTKKTVLKK